MGLSKTLASRNMDLSKDSQDKISRTNCSYSPGTTEHDRSFGNIVTIILIIVSSHVGNSFITRQDGSDDDSDEDTQRGRIKFHRIDSFTIALIYGREGRSSKSGRRCGPTTASISACAFFWISGYSAMVRNRLCTAEVV